ncbi:hypothetical protein A7982_13539 [Minicystis rosea]|nr:hypothetical protein A7982_13539 [Minicystis rosea]
MKLRSTIVALMLAAALVPSVARADTSDIDRATARTLTLEGYEALDRKDYATAADRFARADTLFHAPTVALGLAHAQVGLGKLVEALVTYSRIAHEVLPAGAPPAFVKASDDARVEMAALMPRIPNVVIIVRGAEGVKVTMDGVDVPAAALGVKRAADPGAHVIRATAPGMLPAEVRLSLLEGKVENVDLTLNPDPAAPRALPQPPAIAPPLTAPLAPSPPPAAPEGISTHKALGLAALGTGATGLVVGAITGGLALAKHGAILDQCPDGRCYASQQSALASDVDAFHTLGTVSTATFAAGGVLAATGVVLLVTAPKGKPTREATVKPLLGPGFVGAAGRF